MSQALKTWAGATDLVSTIDTDLNDSFDAVRSSFSGATAPSSPTPVAGAPWLDTSVTPNIFKMYDGANWIPQFAVADSGLGGGYGVTHRYQLAVYFERKPGINADIQNAAESTRMITNPNFEVLGNNGSSDDVTVDVEGGVKLETDGADGDEVIILPHLDANQSAWEQVDWGIDDEVAWECTIKTGSNITNTIIWAGLKLTNTEVTATDADQVFFRFEDDVNGGEWQAVSSIGGADDAHDTDVLVAVDTVYRLVIVIGSDRVARMYINGVLEETTAALTTAVNLIPYIGVAADGAAAAKHIFIRRQMMSKLMM